MDPVGENALTAVRMTVALRSRILANLVFVFVILYHRWLTRVVVQLFFEGIIAMIAPR